MSLRALTAAFLALFAIATVGTGAATYAVTRLTVVGLVDQRIEVISTIVARGETAGKMLARIGTFARQRDTGDIGFVLADADGRRLGGNVALGRALPMGYSSLHARDGIVGLSAGRAFVRRVGGGLVLTTIAETEPVDHYEAARVRIYLAGFGSIVLIAVGGVVAFGRTVARRIGETRRTVDAIIDGDMMRRVPVSGGRHADAFDSQAHAFNRMLDRIGELMAGLRTVSSDVAHDLRTPLARLRGRLGAIARNADNPSLRAEIDDAIAQCDRLLAMFAAMLRITEIEARARTAGFVALRLDVLVGETATMMQPVAADTGHRLDIGIVPALPVTGDPQLLTQALVNVIENAMRHTPAGSVIRAEGSVAGTRGAVTIRDDGPGIPQHQHALALRRFGRLEASRHREGHGLGLPLVAAIVRLHRGELTLDDARPGLAVTMSFPLAPAGGV